LRTLIFCVSSALALFCAAAPNSASAQDFPNRKPIRLIVSGPVASATDLVARLLAEGMKASLGQAVVVENKPAANGALAGAEVARSPADGYSLLLMVTSSMVINPHLNRNVGWNPNKDFTAIAEVGTTASVMAVSADSPFGNFGMALSAARAKPGHIKLGVLTLTLSHFTALALKEEIGADFSIIPFSSQSQMLTAALSHDVDMISTGVASLLPFFESGKLRPLVVTSDTRMQSLPSTPMLADFAHGFSAPNWFGLFGPAGMNPAVVARLNRVVNQLLDQPTFRKQLMGYGTLPSGGTPEAMAKRVQQDFERYRGIVAKSGLKI
jgi:tripartite-type tricarboxylate transporter receptor subunit TctC